MPKHYCTYLLTFDSSPSMVDEWTSSYCLLTEHWLFHGPSDMHRLRWQKFSCCGTVPVEHFAVYTMTDMDSLGDIWKHICLEPRNRGTLWRFSFFAPYKYSCLLASCNRSSVARYISVCADFERRRYEEGLWLHAWPSRSDILYTVASLMLLLYKVVIIIQL